jgi:hypothetical protein
MDTDQPLPPYYYTYPLARRRESRLPDNLELAIGHIQQAARILRTPNSPYLEEALWRIGVAQKLVEAEVGGDKNPENSTTPDLSP